MRLEFYKRIPNFYLAGAVALQDYLGHIAGTLNDAHRKSLILYYFNLVGEGEVAYFIPENPEKLKKWITQDIPWDAGEEEEYNKVTKMVQEDVIETIKFLRSCKDVQIAVNLEFPLGATEVTRLNNSQLSVLRIRHIGKPELFNTHVCALLIIYGKSNNYLSVPPKLIKANFVMELFGSPLNVTLTKYCSAWGVDRLFGSQGSFWKWKPSDGGVYLANPPFDNNIIHKMALHIESVMNVKKPTGVLVTIPVWDAETQKKLGYQKITDIPYLGFDLLLKSKYFRNHEIVKKAIYYDHATDKYLRIVDTHVVYLSTSKEPKFNFENFISQWINEDRIR